MTTREFFTKFSYRQAKRTVVFLTGGSLLLIGLALLLLPGPGVLVLLLGLTILAAEFMWARRWLDRMRETSNHARGRLFNRNKKDIKQPTSEA